VLKLSHNHLTVVAATGAAAIGGTAVAGAADRTSSTTTPTAAPAGGSGETPLTGATKEKVQDAALAPVPGTVLRVETDRGGVYEAHIRKADGTEVEVEVNADFEVTAVNAFDGSRGHGRGGPRADLAAVASKLGVTEAKLEDALQAARSAATPRDRENHAAELAKALGVETSKVQEILDANRPQRGQGGPRGAGRDDAALVSALAKGLSKSEADVRAALEKVRQAHEADHEARETALYAAIAKALGKDAADVKAAFEAARPARTVPTP
jgi:hypothetical protein